MTDRDKLRYRRKCVPLSFLISTIMKRQSLSIVIFLLLSVMATAKEGLTTKPADADALRIIENKGQITDQYGNRRNDIDFSVQTENGLVIFIGAGRLHYQFSRSMSPAERPYMLHSGSKRELREDSFSMYRMDVLLRGSNAAARAETDNQLAYYEHYETAKCRNTTAHAFSRIVYRNIYPNIDWVLYVAGGQLKHEFIVRPGGSVADISLEYAGAQQLKLNSDGGVSAVTPMGTVTEDAPRCFDAHGKVNSHFVLKDSTLSYATDSYVGALTIDPTLHWGTYFNSVTLFIGITTDKNNNVYGTGYTHMLTGVATTGAHQTIMGGGQDAFIVKYNAAGAKQWATYYGGDNSESGEAIASDSAGYIYVAGESGSTTGISTPGTYQVHLAGGMYNDAYLSKFDTMGNLVWATYFGGENYEGGNGVKVAPDGSVYLTGSTFSSTGVATPGAFQEVFGNSATSSDTSDAFLAKFTSSGALLWSTYYGGNGNEACNALSIDTAGNVYISGATSSTNNIATASAYQASLLGGTSLFSDGFLAKFTPTGGRLWGTYFGGEGDERARSVVADASGVYIAGTTASSTHIATPGAHQTVYGGGPFWGMYSDWGDGFLAKFDASGILQWSTYYGGTDNENVTSATTDGHGTIYITGLTASTTGIATPGALISSAPGGFTDLFLAQFNSAGVLINGTYYGGSSTDQGFAIAMGDSATLYVAGLTLSDTGIATAGADETTFIPPTGAAVGCIMKFGICTLPVGDTISGPSSLCLGIEGALYHDGIAGGVWSVSNTRAIITATGLLSPISAGMDTVLYTLTNSCGSVTDMKAISIDTPLSAGILSGSDSVCMGSAITITSTSAGGVWSSGNMLDTITTAGVFTGIAAGRDTVIYTVSNACGTDTAQKVIVIVNCNEGVGNQGGYTNQITLYPNPTEDMLQISTLFDIASVQLYDMTGRLLLSEGYKGRSTTIKLGQFADGVYLLHINNTYSIKVIKR
jgi:hypothetical protein